MTPRAEGTAYRGLAPARFASARPVQSEYDFLLGRLCDAATLARAEALAKRWGVALHEVLIANGWVSADAYYRALADHCGIGFTDSEARLAPLRWQTTPRQCLAEGLLRERDRARFFVLVPERVSPNQLRRVLPRLDGTSFSLSTPKVLRGAICRHFATELVENAVEDLRQRHPQESAGLEWARWQLAVIVLGLTVLLLGLLIDLSHTVRSITLLLGLVFLPVIGLRIAAIAALVRPTATQEQAARIADAELPIYTLLVPLYREARVLPSLLRALSRLDYPAPKLDIKLILEEDDQETLAAVRAIDLPGPVETIVLPKHEPRTKPKALNYALPLARGDYLVIYDAEDRPEPGQLRRALDAFRNGPPQLACVQARLAMYNAQDNWLTRQFAIEYAVLFDGILPLLDKLGLPIPLGGTSNHFRVSALHWLAAWDPFNVTEDADLGMRLARKGYYAQIIPSSTFEEAPARLWPWMKQRTRWLKGFMQTYAVHMRAPLRLWRELGPAGFLGLQIVLAGTVLSALVHPWFYALLAHDLLAGIFLHRPQGVLTPPLWAIAVFNLLAGYLASMRLGLLVVRRRGLPELARQVLWMPLYWLLISVAAYRALWQLLTVPHLWEKTEHGLAGTANQLTWRGILRP